MTDRANRKERTGVVTSDARDKTITIQVTASKKHPRYDKVVPSRTRLHVHDENNDAKRGDLVRVAETRPLSKTKKWRLVEVVERAR
jgi:small subunit ribosomal protein S17